MVKGKNAAKKIAVLALLSGLGLVAFLIENLLPPMFVPGAKPGLANIFSLAALIIYSPAEAFIVVAVRTVLGALITGNVSALMYSFTGGIAAMAVSSLLMCLVYPKISVIAVSVAGAVAHNITQNAVYVLVSGTKLMWGYMPYLALLGVLSGAVVGAVTLLLFRGVPYGVLASVAGGKGKNAGGAEISVPHGDDR